MIATAVWVVLRRLGGLGLVLLGIVDNSLVPTAGSQDILVVVLSAGQDGWWVYYAVMSTVGAVVGGYLTYRLGRKGGEESLSQRLPAGTVKKINRYFERWGFGATFISALLPPPFPVVPSLLAAGALNYPVRKFLLALASARSIRYGLLAYLGSAFGGRVFRFFAAHYVAMFVVALGLSAAAVSSYLIYDYWKKHRRLRRPAQ